MPATKTAFEIREAAMILSINSAQRTNKGTASTATQTAELQQNSAHSQATESKSIQVQTIADESDTKEPLTLVKTDIGKLKLFLDSVEPMIVKALRQNLRTMAAFDQVAMSSCEDIEATNILTLKHADIAQEMSGLCLDWNASGTTISVGYGQANHSEWCQHRGMICTWNIDRRSINPSKADIVLETDSCTTALTFNSQDPALFASGAANGTINIWNLSSDGDKLQASSKSAENGHKESVTSLNWLKVSGENQLVSCGRDGRILVWSVQSRTTEVLHLSRSLLVQLSSLPRELRGKVSAEKEAGITAASFGPKDLERFVVGTETGAVCQCSLNSRELVSTSADNFSPTFSAVSLALAPHNGPVYTVQVSCFESSLVATGSTDGSLRLYNFLKTDWLTTIELGHGCSVFDISWSPARPTVLACASSIGRVAVFDFLHSFLEPVLWLEVVSHGEVVQRVTFNKTQADLLATADANGIVKVWRLGGRFHRQRKGDEAFWRSLLQER